MKNNTNTFIKPLIVFSAVILIIIAAVTFSGVFSMIRAAGSDVVTQVSDTDTQPAIAKPQADMTEPAPESLLVSDTSVPDTSTPDTSAPDTSVPDTSVPDTSAPDTSGADESDTDNPGAADPGAVSENPVILGETPDAGQDYIDRIVFLGDSTTNTLKYYNVLTDNQNTKQIWTGKSGWLLFDQAYRRLILYPETGEEITPVEATERKKPEFLVITLGVNAVSYMNEKTFKSNYRKLIEQLQEASPDTMIILQSIFPVADRFSQMENTDNERINCANGWIIEIAEEFSLRYLDTCSVLFDEAGFLREDYHYDGIHFNPKGCRAVIDYIKKHAADV